VRWLAEHTDEGETAFRVGRDGEEFVAEWVGLIRLRALRDGSHVIERSPDADPREIAKVENGGVRLLLRHLRGELGLHGAAVASGGNAIVVLGRAHQGKSTLAAALCGRGFALLSDDAVALDRRGNDYVAVGLERQHWLDARACRATGMLEASEVPRSGKAPVAASYVGTSGRVVALVDLRFGGLAPTLERARPLEAMAVLVPQAVRFVLDDPLVHRREIDALSALVEAVPLFILERPRTLALLSESCDRLSDLLRCSPARGPAVAQDETE
jgi:hypothetical protein